MAAAIKMVLFNVKKFLLSVLFGLTFFGLHAQGQFVGFSAGLSFDLGTKVNRVGISAGAYYTYNFAQVNASFKAYYNFQSLGLKQKTPEIQLGGGINFGYGKRDTLRNRFTGLGENNTEYLNSFGYSYTRYWDRNQTSQSTGLFNIQIREFRFLTENDLFGAGKGWRDRFRTGAFLVDYTYHDLRFTLASTFWTGDFIGCAIIENDPDYQTRFGYRRTEGSTYGNFSLGLLSAQVNWLVPGVPLNQNARLNIGVDAEQVRYVVQNQFIHDQPFLPDKLSKPTPHIPMLSSDGGQYLFKPDQKIRPVSFYFNAGLNSPVFY